MGAGSPDLRPAVPQVSTVVNARRPYHTGTGTDRAEVGEAVTGAQPTSGRDALAARLGQLQVELRRLGRTQTAAVEEANRRRREAAGQPEHAPWPRGEGGTDLSVQTVNGWFPKRSGAEPAVPGDFEDLWAVIVVMLEWAGQFAGRRQEAELRRDWKALHADAQRGHDLDARVRGYLEAARRFAGQHPYPGVAGRAEPPALAEVYVRQRSRPSGGDHHARAEREGAAAVVEPAEAVFRTPERVCVVIAGPGSGKSTLLRTRLRESADEWLERAGSAGKSGAAVPIWVSARDLAGQKVEIPDALAAATRSLGRYGRHPALDRDRFEQRPCTGAQWLLLVDSLDELPSAAERRAVLEKLANAAGDDPPYRCVVATRPLADNELDALDRGLGYQAPRFYLEPFTATDLCSYTDNYFGTRWPQPEAARRAQQFADALLAASLAELARTPLMAFMLCQLYLAAPESPLPHGRSAVYEAFTDVVYEKNDGKRVADSHKKAIKRLVKRCQAEESRKEVRKAARQVYQRLPELIGYLAHQWRSDVHRASAAATLASHEAVRRPGKVAAEDWDAFLESLLRHTGVLVQQANGLDFIHPTFLEYHAARYATRDEQARGEVFYQLFSMHILNRHGWEGLSGIYNGTSYLGFLLDRLLADEDRFAAETTQCIEELLDSHQRQVVCQVLAKQIRFRTNLPHTAVGHLARLAEDPAVDADSRATAAMGLIDAEGYRDTGAAVLASLAECALSTPLCVRAARKLVTVEGYRKTGATLLADLAKYPGLNGFDRTDIAQDLARVEGFQDMGAALLASFAENPLMERDWRRKAVINLGQVEGCRDTCIDLLTRLVESPSLDDSVRLKTLQELAGNVGRGDAGAALFTRIAANPDLDGHTRFSAAIYVGKDAAIALLLQLAESTAPSGAHLIRKAVAVAREDGDRDAGAAILGRLAQNPTAGAADRAWAARDLARIEGYRDRGAALLADLAANPDLDCANRAWAAAALAKLQEAPPAEK